MHGHLSLSLQLSWTTVGSHLFQQQSSGVDLWFDVTGCKKPRYEGIKKVFFDKIGRNGIYISRNLMVMIKKIEMNLLHMFFSVLMVSRWGKKYDAHVTNFYHDQNTSDGWSFLLCPLRRRIANKEVIFYTCSKCNPTVGKLGNRTPSSLMIMSNEISYFFGGRSATKGEIVVKLAQKRSRTG